MRVVVDQGCQNGVFGKRALSPAKTGGVDENGENYYCSLPTQARGFVPHTLEVDKTDKNGMCHSCKITICQKHRSDNPELRSKQTNV